MTTVFVGVLFFCLSGECHWATTDKRIYPKLNACAADVEFTASEVKRLAPEAAVSGSCIKVEVGNI